MKLTQEHIVEVRSEIVIVGFNPENADMDNPDGAIHKVAYYVIITDDVDGGRIRHEQHFFDIKEAEKLADRIVKRGEINAHHWGDTRPMYGSKAYIDQIEEEIYLEKKFDI